MAQKSEFASLSDIVLSQGIPHSEIISEIHDRVLVEYKRLYPDEIKTVEVLVNEKTGEVRLMRDKEDVTPASFISTAERVAREVVIEKLGTGKEKVPESVETEIEVPKKESGLGKWLFGIIFWGYNFLYIFILFIFIANFLINKNYREDFFEIIKNLGIHRALFIGIAGIVPLITIFTAVKLLSKKTFDKLGTLFFLFEVPLVVLPLFLSNMFQNPTPIIWFFLAIFIFSIPVFFLHILDIQVETKQALVGVTFLREATLLSVGYAVILFSFAVPLILGGIVRMISDYFLNDVFRISTSYYYPHYFNPFEILITIFFGGLFILILLSLTLGPYILFLSLLKIFLKSREKLSKVVASEKADKILAGFAALWFIVFLGLSYQPNADKYIEKLERLSEVKTFEDKEEIARQLLPEETKIKRAFDDLKNVRSRYLMARSDDYVKDAYTEILNFSDISAELVQQSFVALAYPFVYQGSLDRSQIALKSFEYLFGRDLYGSSQATGVKNVNLVEREISAKTDYEGLIATVTVTEEYQNSTFQDQEVIYEFSLPADSVVIDLKLGPELEFPGIIAPKGAAARTYQQEVTRRRDPALLEETGPSQYRLRVFPVPAKNSNVILGKNQKVQFSYVTPITFKGFGLPVYSKEQNIKTGKIRYLVEGQDVTSDGAYLTNDSISDTIQSPCSRKNSILANAKFASASAYLIPNIALVDGSDCGKDGASLAKTAKNLRIALIFDVSYTNKNNKLIDQTKDLIKNNSSLLSENTVEVYKFNDLLSEGKIIKDTSDDNFDFDFFGVSDWVKAVHDLDGTYDFAILITNEDQPPLKQTTSIKKDFPVYLVHENEIPPYTTTITGELFQGGGNIFTDMTGAFNAGVVGSMAKNHSGGNELIMPGPTFSYYSDVSVDQLMGVDWLNINSGVDSLSKIIAKKLVDRKMKGQPGALDSQIGFLDTLHKFALANTVVTPYSSLIALVNERQLQNLQQQAQNMDRYKELASPATGGTIRNPAIGVSPFGMETLDLVPGAQMRGVGGGMFGAIAQPGMAAFDGGGGGFGFSGFSLIILANVIILGGGLTIFIFLKIKKSFKRK